ncbi:MAG: hypothetical protein L0Y57_00695 [Beijerinckiaceae bacterium]|nr:hypothetical protein [Beijerinckiaceae bacterium]
MTALDEKLHAGSEESRAGALLVLFMRFLAGLWVFQGLLQWGAILLPPEPLFDNMPPLRGAAVIFFAVFDLVAAAGLWLAAPWGGVIWLLGAIAQIAVAAALPGFFSLFWIGGNIVLIAVYFALAWKAGHGRGGLSMRRQQRDEL